MKLSSTPLISVLIANYNGEGLLCDCIGSVISQDGGLDVEIIVHDDASSDGSLALLRDSYPQVRVIASPENVGFCISNNRMADAATGKYLLLLNNDAALAPNALQMLLSEQALLATPSILTLPQYDWETGMLVDRGCLLDPFFNPIPNIDPELDDVAYVIGACLWCPRETWCALGGFPEWMESIGEDLYLCNLARLRGIPVRALRNSHYRHHQGASFGGNRADGGLSSSLRRRRLSERNKTRALMVLTPGAIVWPLLVVHLIALAGEGLMLSLLRRNVTLLREIYMPAIVTPFREWAGLRMYRCVVQESRTVPVRKWYSVVRWELRKLSLLKTHGVPKVR